MDLDFTKKIVELTASLSKEQAVDLLEQSISRYRQANASNEEDRFKELCLTSAIVAGMLVVKERGTEQMHEDLIRTSRTLNNNSQNNFGF